MGQTDEASFGLLQAEIVFTISDVNMVEALSCICGEIRAVEMVSPLRVPDSVYMTAKADIDFFFMRKEITNFQKEN